MPSLTDDQIAQLREALSQPGLESALSYLPPEIGELLQRAAIATQSVDPRGALASLAEEQRGNPLMSNPSIVQAMLGSIVGDALGALGDPATLAAGLKEVQGAIDELTDIPLPEGIEAGTPEGDAFQDVLGRIDALDLDQALGPIVREIGSITSALQALPQAMAASDAAPDAMAKALAGLGDRTRALEAQAEHLSGEAFAQRTVETFEALQRLLDLADTQSPEVALMAAAAQARVGSDTVLDAMARALDLAENAGHVAVGLRASSWLQAEALKHEDFAEAAALAGRSAALAERGGDAATAIAGRFEQGLFLVHAGDREQGQALVEAGLADARAIGDVPLVARGVVTLGRIFEATGAKVAALQTYEGLLKQEAISGAEGVMALASLGLVRCLPADALTDPRRLDALVRVRDHARQRGDATTFAQAGLLLAESEEALGRRAQALGTLLECKVALQAQRRDTAWVDKAIQVFRNDWGQLAFDQIFDEVVPRG